MAVTIRELFYIYLIMTLWMRGQGPNDDAAGVAIMLETIRIMMASPQVKNDVMFLFTDGEEYGILGSTAYVGNHSVEEISLVVNLEARGNKGKSMLFETAEHNYGTVREFVAAASMPYGYSFINDIYKVLPNYTDYEPFKGKGARGLNFAYIEGLDVYHNEKDNIESVTLASVQHNGQNAMEMAQHFGNLDSRSLDTTKEKAVYFNLFGYQMIVFSTDYNKVLSLAAALLFSMVMLITWRKRSTTFRKIGIWLFTLISLAMISFIVGAGLILGKAMYYGLIPLPVTLMIIGLGTAGIAVSVFFMIRRKTWLRWKARLGELTLLDCLLSNLLVGMILTGLSYGYTPSSNYLFAIPVFIQSIVMLIYYGMGTQQVIRWMCSILAVIPVLLILFPLWYMVGLSIGWMGLPFLVIIVLLTAPYLIPMVFLPVAARS